MSEAQTTTGAEATHTAKGPAKGTAKAKAVKAKGRTTNVRATRAGKAATQRAAAPAARVATAEDARVAQARAQSDAAEALNASPGFREAPANPSHESTLGALDGVDPAVAREYSRTGRTPESHIRKVTANPRHARDAGLEVDDAALADEPDEDERRRR